MPFWEERLTKTSNRVTHPYIWRACQKSMHAHRAAQSSAGRRRMTLCALRVMQPPLFLRSLALQMRSIHGILVDISGRTAWPWMIRMMMSRKKRSWGKFAAPPMTEQRKQKWNDLGPPMRSEDSQPLGKRPR